MGNTNVKGPLTEGQLNAATILKIVCSIPSLMGSAYIFQHVVRSNKRRRRVFTRLMLAMASMDFLFAFQGVASSMPCPRELPIFLAIGTWKSCEAFGFLGQASKLTSILYSGGLAVYFLLSIRNGWTERWLRKLEILVHVLCCFVGWGMAILALHLDLYNPTTVGCQIYAFPPRCEVQGTPCLRGGNAAAYQLGLFLYPVWGIFALMVTSMILIYRRIAKTEIGMSMYSLHGRSDDRKHQQQQKQPSLQITKLRRGFAIQALLYCSAFFLTWVFATVGAAIVEFSPAPEFYFPITVLSISLSSLHGFFNACIYIRPRYLRYRQRQQSRQEQAAGESSSRDGSAPTAVDASVMNALRQALSVAAVDDEDELSDLQKEQQQQEANFNANPVLVEQGCDEAASFEQVTMNPESHDTSNDN